MVLVLVFGFAVGSRHGPMREGMAGLLSSVSVYYGLFRGELRGLLTFLTTQISSGSK